MAVTRSSKKKQTRLTFQPLPTSSPQATSHSSSRPSPVTIRGAKKRIVESEEPPSSPPFTSLLDEQESKKSANTLPTPQPTSELSEADATDDGNEAEVPIITTTRKRLASRRTILESDDEDDSTGSPGSEVQELRPGIKSKSASWDEQDEDEDDVRSPIRRRTYRRRSAVSQRSESELHEEQELADDVNDLESNILQETRTRPSTTSKQRIKYKNQLEVLKARREARSRGDNAQISEVLESDSTEEGNIDPFVSDEDDEGFLSDNDDLVDVPTQLKDTIPLYSISSPEEAFDIVVEWLLYKKLSPNFDSRAEKYRIALRKLDDQAATFAGSKFSSSAWRPDFYRALNARPYLKDKGTGVVYTDSCQACGRSSHPATWHMRFTGPVYNGDTLEPIDDEDEESRDYDIDGNPLVSEDYQFSLGRDCRNNAVYAHSFKHWRYHLNSRVMDHLANQGVIELAETAIQENWGDERLATLAETALEEMKADQSMDDLWTEFRDRIEQAESSKAPGSGRQFISE